MSILFHIVFAIASMIITGITAVKPSGKKLNLTYVSIFLTLGSGALLAVLDHALLTRVCMTGLAYLTVEVAAVVASLYRLRVAAKETR